MAVAVMVAEVRNVSTSIGISPSTSIVSSSTSTSTRISVGTSVCVCIRTTIGPSLSRRASASTIVLVFLLAL